MTLARLAASITADTGVLIYPDKAGDWNCVHIGMTHEEVAELLYRLADEIVDLHIPPPDWRQRIR